MDETIRMTRSDYVNDIAVMASLKKEVEVLKEELIFLRGIVSDKFKGSGAISAQHTQPAKCLSCEYWKEPSAGCCMRGDGDAYCVKVGTQRADA